MSRTVGTGEESPWAYSGFLVKRAISGKNSWKRRYFCLDKVNKTLSYHKKPPKNAKTKAKGVLTFTRTSRAEVADYPPMRPTTKVLKVTTPDKILVAVEENGDIPTLQRWADAINHNIVKELDPEAYGAWAWRQHARPRSGTHVASLRAAWHCVCDAARLLLARPSRSQAVPGVRQQVTQVTQGTRVGRRNGRRRVVQGGPTKASPVVATGASPHASNWHGLCPLVRVGVSACGWLGVQHAAARHAKLKAAVATGQTARFSLASLAQTMRVQGKCEAACYPVLCAVPACSPGPHEPVLAVLALVAQLRTRRCTAGVPAMWASAVTAEWCVGLRPPPLRATLTLPTALSP